MNRVRPTRRGFLVLAGAAIAYLVGWAFGTRELAALALALALAVVLASITVWLASRTPPRMQRRLPPRAVAGQPLEAAVHVDPAPRLVSATVVDRCPGLGDPVARLVRSAHALEGSWQVAEPARGRYLLAPELVLEDLLGLVRARVALAAPGRVRVEPRLVELAVTRSLAFAQRDGTRHAFASNAGDGLAGVRDHEVGESLRRVHWRTTARRGRLTVRELEDHPREELHVLLDAARQDADAGTRSLAFERAVEAAGSLALHAARCGISVAFEAHGSHEQRVAVASGTRAALLDAPLLGRGRRLGAARCAARTDRGRPPLRRHLRRRPGRGRSSARAARAPPRDRGRRGRPGLVRRSSELVRRGRRGARARRGRGGSPPQRR